MLQEPEANWEALTAFLLAEHSIQQGDEVRRWLAESAERRKMLDSLRSALHSDPTSSAELRGRTWASIQSRIAAQSIEAKSGLRTEFIRVEPRRRLPWRNPIAWVISAAAIGVAVTMFVLSSPGRRVQDIATIKSPVEQEVITRAGRNTMVRLPDGSRVVLGVASRLRYATTFARSERDVYLDGQAYFTVTHAAGWPFVVHVGTTTARVLGTRFSVRKYATDSVARVVVEQGRVTVRHAVLNAGDAMQVWADGTSIITHSVDLRKELAWAEAKLSFDATPLSNAIPELERSFGIVITVGDSTLLNEPITISIQDENAHDALQIIATLTHSRALWSRNHVLLARP